MSDRVDADRSTTFVKLDLDIVRDSNISIISRSHGSANCIIKVLARVFSFENGALSSSKQVMQ